MYELQIEVGTDEEILGTVEFSLTYSEVAEALAKNYCGLRDEDKMTEKAQIIMEFILDCGLEDYMFDEGGSKELEEFFYDRAWKEYHRRG